MILTMCHNKTIAQLSNIKFTVYKQVRIWRKTKRKDVLKIMKT